MMDSELDLLLNLLPEELSFCIDIDHLPNLNEIVVDLGRFFEYRVNNFQPILSSRVVTQEDIDRCLTNLPAFRDDGRVGIQGTLHRVSCVSNKHNEVVGLTFRVGRAISSTLILIQDLVDDGSVLILGSPGRGKSTYLRQASNYLSKDRRVIVVDKSSEIGGESSPAHKSIGNARRFEIPSGKSQEQIMIFALESHTPQCMIIDEISTIQEAQAARTIAQRGIQLIATAHGNELSDLLQNPPLCSLIGGVGTVTLTDELAAKTNNGKKTRQERQNPGIFDYIVEIKSFDEVYIYHDVDNTIDEVLNEATVKPEIRRLASNGVVLKIQEFGVKKSTPEMTRVNVSDFSMQERKSGNRNRKRY